MIIFITPAAAPILEITYTYSLLLKGNRLAKINKIEIIKDKSIFLLFSFIQKTSILYEYLY